MAGLIILQCRAWRFALCEGGTTVWLGWLRGSQRPGDETTILDFWRLMEKNMNWRAVFCRSSTAIWATAA